MSASINNLGKNNLGKDDFGHIVPLSGSGTMESISHYSRPGSEAAALQSGVSQISSLLPKIRADMEALFSITEENAAALTEEKMITRKYREEIQELQLKNSRLHGELATLRRDLSVREENFKSEIAGFRKREHASQDQISQLTIRIEDLVNRETHLKRQVQSDQAHLRQFEQVAEDLKNKNDLWQKNYERLEVEFKALKSQLSHQDDQLKRYMVNLTEGASFGPRSSEKSHEYWESQQKLQKVVEDLEVEKRFREKLEELVKKERREKEVALRCLHTTEAKLGRNPLESKPAQYNSNKQDSDRSEDSGLKLEF